MAEYINRDAVHDLVRSLTKYAWTSPDNTGHRVTVDADDVNFGVDKIPSADVAPVRHGRWIMKHRHRGGFHRYTGIDDIGEQHTITVDERVEYDDRYCSECGKQSADNFLNYCPNCGAKMDLED